MAKKEHTLPLFQSIVSGNGRIWNNWRVDHPDHLPDLSARELSDLRLPFFNLSRSDLGFADLRKTGLCHATVREPDLSGVNLRNANLRETDLKGARLFQANLREADLRNAKSLGADMRGAVLFGPRLRGANFTDVPIDPEEFKHVRNQFGIALSRPEKVFLLSHRRRDPNRLHNADVTLRDPEAN